MPNGDGCPRNPRNRRSLKAYYQENKRNGLPIPNRNCALGTLYHRKATMPNWSNIFLPREWNDSIMFETWSKQFFPPWVWSRGRQRACRRAVALCEMLKIKKKETCWVCRVPDMKEIEKGRLWARHVAKSEISIWMLEVECHETHNSDFLFEGNIKVYLAF